MKNNSISIYLTKILLCTIITLLIAITCKKNPIYKEKIHDLLFVEKINFSKFKNIYNKYLGGFFFIKTDKETNSKESYVFNNKLKYTKIENYKDGAKIYVDKNYLITNLNNGIVVYLGKKEDYNYVIIVEDEKTGINTWYGNICNSTLKLYDNITTNDYIGESCSNYIYLLYSKNNTFLDYRNYFK